MGYKLFENGNESEEYSFGESYEEEILEMGIDLATQTRKDGTLVVTNEQGEKFIDKFLRIHKAYIALRR